ncbi:MAG: ATP synthase F1 subunit delta [Bacteroidota bacterium]
MNESSISVRYARALFQSAKDKGLMEEVNHDMELLLSVCRNEGFNRMIETPVLSGTRKCELLDHMFGDRISALTKSLLELVIRNRRDQYLQGIARYYRELYKKDKGIRSVSLVTAKPLDKETGEKFAKIIQKAFSSEIEMTTAVREELIGGFLLTVEDQLYDASVASSLKKIRKHLLQSTTEKK